MVNAMLILGTPKLQIATHTVFVFVFAYLVADGELQLLHHIVRQLHPSIMHYLDQRLSSTDHFELGIRSYIPELQCHRIFTFEVHALAKSFMYRQINVTKLFHKL